MRIETYNVGKARLICYLQDGGLKFGQSLKHPAMIVCPGGGYIYRSPREADPVALSYAQKGFHACVLEYSCGWDALGFAPLHEIDEAIGLLREHADEWMIDETQICVCGFSAGGHLALSSAIYAKNKPDALVLGYPAVDVSAAIFMVQLFTGKKQVTAEDCAPYNLLQNLPDELPPVFMFTTGDDAITKKQTLELALALEERGTKLEYHRFGFGPHGYGIATEAGCDGSSQILNAHVAKWMDLSVEFLIEAFGGLTFKDVSTSRMMEVARELGIDFGAKVEADHA